jgi:predicted nuclease of predicted toxin-antitoxin system
VARRKRSSSARRLQPHQFGLLIDENLSPALVKFAGSRGFYTRHVNEVNLRTTTDKAVATFAIAHNLVVVTNNMADFRRHYRKRKFHPGLIFLACDIDEIFTKENQAALLNVALDEILAITTAGLRRERWSARAYALWRLSECRSGCAADKQSGGHEGAEKIAREG